MKKLLTLISLVESKYFASIHSPGATASAVEVWNQVREHAGLTPLSLDTLPRWCVTHQKYHVINSDYGCVEGVPPVVVETMVPPAEVSPVVETVSGETV